MFLHMKAKQIFLILSTLAFTACSNDTPSFSLLSDEETFKQTTSELRTKVDVLWVVDNSGSMQTSQQNLAASFQSFIQKFQDKSYDFQMAVTTTDAYISRFSHDPNDSRFRDGTDSTGHSGVFIMDENTPNLDDVFLKNIVQGLAGHGDERAFQSIYETLENPLNNGFVRSDSFLAVIIVSDEDDFSHDGQNHLEFQYSNTALHKADDYVSYLEGLTQSTGVDSRFLVSAMAIFDQDCHTELTDAAWTGRKIAYRYEELVDKTGGIKGSLCDDFSDNLGLISDKIIELATQFYLSRTPVIATIKVFVDDHEIAPIDVQTNPTNGWSYDASSKSIRFHGSSVPGQGANIRVTFDPVTWQE